MLKNRVRIKQFFQDFDRLRKGTVGEAAVNNYMSYPFCIVQDEFGNVKLLVRRGRNSITD